MATIESVQKVPKLPTAGLFFSVSNGKAIHNSPAMGIAPIFENLYPLDKLNLEAIYVYSAGSRDRK